MFEPSVQMAIFTIGLTQPRLAMQATEYLLAEGLVTKQSIAAAVKNNTLTEDIDIQQMNVIEMIDHIMSTEQSNQFK